MRFRFRNAIFPSWFLSRWRLSPLFHEDAQIFIFPAPISCLGERYLPASIYGVRAIVGRFPRGHPLLGIGATSSHSDPHDSRDALVARCRIALSSQRTSVGLYPWRYLIGYLYRCEFCSAFGLFFLGELEGPSCSQPNPRWHGRCPSTFTKTSGRTKRTPSRTRSPSRNSGDKSR